MKNFDKEMFDIIEFALPRWEGTYSSTSFSLAKELSKSNRVFYIDNPYTFKDYIKLRKSPSFKKKYSALFYGTNNYFKINQSYPDLTGVVTRLTIPVNFLKKGLIYSTLSKINDRIIFSSMRKLIKDYNIKRFIYLNSFNPFYCINFPKDINPDIKIYQTVDEIRGEPYIARHGVYLEEEIIKKYDFTLATSKELTRLKSLISKHVYYLPNAADISIFKKALEPDVPKPIEIKDVDKKIIGYTGNIGLRLDYNLLKQIAITHKDKILLLVGPKDKLHFIDNGLDKLPNVIFTGSKNVNELPAYLKYIDCAIIPFEKTELTKSIYPLKINEYLAAGKPVVMTDFSDLSEFSSVTYIAKTNEEFVNNINIAIENNASDKILARVKTAEENTWECRVNQFWRITEEYLNNKKDGSEE